MTARQIRRADERNARKAAYQASKYQTTSPISETPNEAPDEQTAKAPESELQSVKVCTGRTMLLPAADALAYRTHVDEFFERLNPEGPRESEIVQALADLQWRLDRIPRLEQGLYAYGRVQYAKLFAQHEDSDLRASLIDSHTLITHAKQFSNLAAQELRLFRYSSHYRAELAQLQLQRARLAHIAEEEAEQSRSMAVGQTIAAPPNPIGFEFSSGVNRYSSLPTLDFLRSQISAKASSMSQER